MSRSATGVALLASVLAGCTSNPASSEIDAGAIDASVEDAGPPIYAFVSLERWQHAGKYTTQVGVVPFHRGADAALPRFVKVDDYCAYHEGMWSKEGTAAPSFGTVTMRGGAEGEVTLTPDANGAGYATPASAAPGWSAGDVMTVVASGGELPAFELSGTVPVAPTLTAPASFALRRARPLSLTWQPFTGEVFVLVLQLDDDMSPPRGVQCFFPADAGTATISSAVLAHLSAGDMKRSFVYFAAVARQHAALTGVDVDLLVWNGASFDTDVE